MPANEQQYARGSLEGKVLAIEILTQQIRDPDTSYGLRDAMVSLVDEAKPEHIVLDFRNVSFVGSVGFLAFLAVRRHLQDGRIVICNISDSVRQVFEICRLIARDPSAANPFLLEDSFEAALARCAG